MNEQLKPCKCGSPAVEIVEAFLEDATTIRCVTCGAETGECATREEAVQAWNRRMEAK